MVVTTPKKIAGITFAILWCAMCFWLGWGMRGLYAWLFILSMIALGFAINKVVKIVIKMIENK